MREMWKDIKGFEGVYQVSDCGRVKSLKRGIILKPYSNKKGYKIIVLPRDGVRKHFQIHKLVLNTFQPLVDKTQIKKLPNEMFPDFNDVQVNHLDNNPTNNNLNNLEYCTNAYNINYTQCKAIKQYDPGDNFIKRWDGVNIAKRKTGINNIERCLAGKCKSAGGYVWKYDDK